MHRLCMNYLKQWLYSSNRKPLVIRGARQVGKTWLVRELARSEDKALIEINFEKRPNLASVFSANDPAEVIQRISQRMKIKIDVNKSILFLDEIQEKPEVYEKLRWFKEEMPEFPVIAAGSLLEFVLSKKKLRMPVGRVNFMYLEPMNFIEFLLSQKADALVELIQNFTWKKKIVQETHEQLIELFKEYIIVGGLPEAVHSWAKDRSLEQLSIIQNDIIGAYRGDFKNYAGKIDAKILDNVIEAVPQLLGKKFVYSSIDSAVAPITLKKSLHVLCDARVCSKVTCSKAQGVPLNAEINSKFFKVLLLDVGLCSTLLDLSLDRLQTISNLGLVNKGGIAEQVVGQILRTIRPCYVEPNLYYWLRPSKSSGAEIDYVIQHATDVIPIEVKSGAVGSLKSLHSFMANRDFKRGVRIYSGLPLKSKLTTKDTVGQKASYDLLSLPFYLVSEVHRLLDI